MTEDQTLVYPACQNCQHPFELDWPDLGLVYACPKCHRIHKQVMIEITEDHTYFLLGEITEHTRSWQPEVHFQDGEMHWLPFKRSLN